MIAAAPVLVGLFYKFSSNMPKDTYNNWDLDDEQEQPIIPVGV